MMNRHQRYITRGEYFIVEILEVKMLSSVSDQLNSSQEFGKQYYKRYIHDNNKDLITRQQKAKDRYLPIDQSKQQTFKEKFKKYMVLLDNYDEKQIKARETGFQTVLDDPDQTLYGPNRKKNFLKHYEESNQNQELSHALFLNENSSSNFKYQPEESQQMIDDQKKRIALDPLKVFLNKEIKRELFSIKAQTSSNLKTRIYETQYSPSARLFNIPQFNNNYKMKEGVSRSNHNNSQLNNDQAITQTLASTMTSNKKFQSVTKIQKPTPDQAKLDNSPILRKSSNNNLNQDYISNGHQQRIALMQTKYGFNPNQIQTAKNSTSKTLNLLAKSTGQPVTISEIYKSGDRNIFELLKQKTTQMSQNQNDNSSPSQPVAKKQLEDMQFHLLKDKFLNGEIKMDFKSNLIKRRFMQGNGSQNLQNQMRFSVQNSQIGEVLQEDNKSQLEHIIEQTGFKNLSNGEEIPQQTTTKKKKKKKINITQLSILPPSYQAEEAILDDSSKTPSQDQIGNKVFQTDLFNIDLENDNDGLEFREIEDDELKSDFDETKGLGRPSIDSFTKDEVEVNFDEQNELLLL
ncbi:UNKNOWN [Stylonychia lemnae]|uniref:Uncharacterized protein n=1 Tax=Stylonychia lemnae TaxID=5949 RepID=A0A078B141_STYLE|nr:UNKNOWN [Stylonychia lemnae]|eukprot:CDW88046.1 UNKNOWN [Stylonychia lemnae]